jgi:hypothetical protein
LLLWEPTHAVRLHEWGTRDLGRVYARGED